MKNTPVTSTSRRQFVGQLAAGAAAMTLAPGAARAAGGQPPPLPSKKLGIALLGLGGYATGQLAPALQRTQHCQLMGVVTGDPAGKGKRWAAQYGFPEKNIYSYDTMEGLKDNPDIDIVYVVTPNSLHKRDTLAAAKAGKHVISEKPMGVSVADCDEMIAACKAAGVQLGIGYRNNFDPYFQEMMRIARWKEMGPIKAMNGEFSGNINQPGAWRTKLALAGGGPVMDLGIYVIHASLLASGGESPVAVTAKSTVNRREIYADVEEIMEFTLEFANGAKCDGYTSYAGNKPGGAGGNRFHVDYANGFVDFPAAFNYAGTRATTSTGPLSYLNVAAFTQDNTYQQARQMDDFARCVRDKVPTSVPGQMGRQDMCVVEAIYASAKNNGARTLVRV